MSSRLFMRLVSVSILAIQFGCGPNESEVGVATVRLDRLRNSYVADAFVRAKTATISSRDIAVIDRILVDEGDSVAQGQTVVQLRTSDIVATVREAESAVRVARNGLAQAQEAVRAAKVDYASKVSVAQAAVRESEARLAQAKQMARPATVRAAEHRVESLRAVLVEAERTLARVTMLYAEGAISRSALDQAEAKEASARQQFEAAQDDLRVVKAGPTPADVAVAVAALESARSQLAAARVARSEIDVLGVSAQQAEARVHQALSSVDRARTALGDRMLRSPLSGRVLRIDVEPGEVASPGLALVVVVDPSSVFVEAEVGDEDASKVLVGQVVDVTSASYPGRRIPGKVRRISPAAERKVGAVTDRRVLRFEVDLTESRNLFGPGEEVDVYGESTSKTPALLVPSDAVSTSGGKNFVWKVENGRARRIDVRLGDASFQDVEVFGELKEGDQVAVSGKDALTEGAKVKVGSP